MGTATVGRPHVLVARLDNLGDVLLAGPAVRAVAASASRVTMLVSPRTAEVARLLPGVDDVLTFEAPWIASPPVPVEHRHLEELIDAVTHRTVDSAVILTSFHQSPLPLALLLRVAGVGHVSAISEDYPGSLLDVRHQPPGELHEVRRNLALVEAAGHDLPEDDDAGLRVLRPPTRPIVADLEDYVVVHPGASVSARTWPVDRFCRAAAALVEAGHPVVVTGVGAERSSVTAVARAAAAADPGSVSAFAGTLDLSEMVEVVARARAIVVGNTGPAHLAAAVGTPVVSLYAPTVPAARWRPWQVPHVLLGDQEIGCRGCRAHACPFGSLQPCLAGVTAADVVDAVRLLTGSDLGAGARHLAGRPQEAGR